MQDLHGPAAQRHAMLALGLHPFGRHGPYGGGKIDLVPRRQPHLARPCRREDQELERQLGAEPRAGAVHCSDRSRYLAMRQGRHMADVFRTFGESCRDGLAGRIVLAVSLRDGPVHDRADSPSHLARGFVLARPDRHEDSHHVGGRDLVDARAADLRVGVRPERRPPERSRLAAVLPCFAMERDDLVDRRLERRRSGLASFRQQVSTVSDGAAVREGPVAGHRQRDDRPAAEAEIVPAAVDRDPLDPVLRAARRDDEMQRAADYGLYWNIPGPDGTGRWRPQRDSNPCLSLERARS